MSESAKKRLKQMRLPFAIIAESDKETNPEDNSSPKSTVSTRKRKPSNDADDSKSTKLVCLAKENVQTPQEVLEIIDLSEDKDDNEEMMAVEPSTLKTPTTSNNSVLHIKLPSCSKSKRKINMGAKPAGSLEEEDLDDSVVYLEDEDCKSTKKSKKSEKKARKTTHEKSNSVRKNLNTDDQVENENHSPVPKNQEIAPNIIQHEENSTKSDLDAAKIEVPSEKKNSIDEISAIQNCENENINSFNTVPTNVSSTAPEDPDVIHEEIIEFLSDDSDSNKISTSINEVGKTPTSVKKELMNLTPKQLARRQEQEARRIEKELQRQKERELKEQQRLKEKEQREEAKRKEREEKEEARKREKEERDRKRQAEQDKRDEEKRQKEEERKRLADQRDEEKRQKEEERKRQVELREEDKRKRDEVQRKKEIEEENRKKRAAEAFSKFFVAKKKSDTTIDDDASKDSSESCESSGVLKSSFMPFQIRDRMKLAPCVRRHVDKEELKILDESLITVKPLNDLYLNLLKHGLHKPRFSVSTWPMEDKDDDVITIDELEGAGEDIPTDESKKMKQRAKYLMFSDNRRPPYHGTWRKKTSKISARKPFAQDRTFFDYEVDSDEEWEEEEPGESLHGSDSEKEKDIEEDDYEVDNDFFVPHGHLSDEEMQQMDDEINEDNHPEAQKAKLKILQQEFAAEMKKKTEKIKPRLIGCIWMNGDEDENGFSKSGGMDKKYHCSDIIWRILKAREMMTSEESIKLENDLEPEVAELDEKISVQVKAPIRVKFVESSIKDLIRLIHGNTNSKRFIIKEFQAYRLKNFYKDHDFQEFSGRSVEEKMMEIADYKTCPEEGPLFGKKCWLVKPETLQEYYGEEKCPLPNEWLYILEKEVKEKKPKQQCETMKKEELPDNLVPVAQQRPAGKISEEICDNPPPSTNDVSRPQQRPGSGDKKPQPSVSVPKKRVQLLMSGPRGQEISQSKKNNLISQYLKGKNEDEPATD